VLLDENDALSRHALSRAVLWLEITALVGDDRGMSPEAPTTPRARARAQFQADLLAAARTRIAADGAAQLSLRAVARDLGVASSAVYRYVESRDALLTLLIVEAYDDVASACEAARTSSVAAGVTPGEGWLAVGRAFREWAVAHRHSFELIYGTPVPGYAAPQQTVQHAARVWAAIAGPVIDAAVRGELGPAAADEHADGLVDPGVLAIADGLLTGDGSPAVLLDAEAAPALVVRSLTLFETLVGAVSAELFGHLHNVTTSTARAFDVTLAHAGAGVGLRVAV